MNLDQIWQAVAADNPEAQDYLVRHERELLPVLGTALAAALREPPPPPAEPREQRPFAFEFEMRKPASLVAELADSPHQRTDLFRMLTPVHPQQYRPALVQSLTEQALRLEQDGDLNAAVAHLDEALEHGRQLPEPDRDTTIARCLYERARISLRLGRADEALRCVREAATAATAATADTALSHACGRIRSAILKVFSEIALREGNRAAPPLPRPSRSDGTSRQPTRRRTCPDSPRR